MFVRAICFESTRPGSEHALAIWSVPELAGFAMFAFAVTVLVARWLAIFSVWGPTRGAVIIFGFALGLALAFALALVSGISIAIYRVARGRAGAAGAAPS